GGITSACEPEAQLAAARGYFSSANGRPASQNDRIRAAIFSRRVLSRATAYSSSAARSAAPTRPCVGETQAVGQRVIPLVRINLAIAAAKAHPAVPGWSICSMRVPCAGDLQRARGGTGWLGRDR